MARKLFDNVRHLISTPGGGQITLGTVPATWQGFAAAGAVDGDNPPYELVDGNERENGYLTLGNNVTTAARAVITSTNGNSPINLSGSAVLTCTPIANTFNKDLLSVASIQNLSTDEKGIGLDNLGATTVGKAIFGAADQQAARTVIGATATGSALMTAIDTASARGAAGIMTEVGKIEFWPTNEVRPGRLRCNGAAYLRATYPDLAAVLIKTGTVSFNGAGSSTLGMTGHGRQVNDPIKLFTTGTLPSNFVPGTHGLLSAGVVYYVKAIIDANNVQLSATPGGAALTAGAGGSGVHSWLCAPHGSGDGNTTFTVPEMRGEFVRALDDGRGIDTSRIIGAAQLDAFQGHKPNFGAGGSGEGQSLNNSSSSSYVLPWPSSGGLAASSYWSLVTDGANGTPRTAAETRPRNVAMLATIRFA